MNEIVSPARVTSASPVTVWLLMSGEDHEGGNVLGVFADREQAKGAFVEAARNIPFAIDGAREDEDGSIHLHGGCDWLSLSQEVVQGTAQLEGGAL